MRKIIVYILSILIVLNLYGNDTTDKSKFYLGVHDTPYTDLKINGESINDIVYDLFKNYLGLNVVKVKGDWRKTYNDLDTGKTGALGLVTKDDHRKDNIILSNPIFSENLYVASYKKSLKTFSDLENQNIYVYKDDVMVDNLKRYLKLNHINAKIIEVDRLSDYKNDYFLDSEFTVLGAPNKIFICHLPPVSIGVNKKYSYLLPRINEGIKSIYGDKILKYIDEKSIYYQRENFLGKLTSEELHVLKNTKVLTTAYEDDLTLSMYSKVDDRYIGILPGYINKISKITGIKVKIKSINRFNSTWNEIYNLFKKDKIDFLSLSINNKNENLFIFTNPINYIPIYLLSHPKDKDLALGVLVNGKSEAIGDMYFPYDKIKKFSSKKKLFKAFHENEVNSIITTYSFNEANDDYLYKVEEIGEIPINFAFHKDEEILKNIFNKAISVIGEYDKKKIISQVDYEKKQILANVKEENFKYLLSNIMICLFTIVLILISVYKYKKYKKIEKLAKYDILTKLQNRVLFDKVCFESNEKTGLVGVLDLDHFKSVNDTFGHSMGDLILIEMGVILLEVYGKKSTFRISGDEFYIFDENIFSQEKINSLMETCRKSKIFKKYGVTISFGYIFKNENLKILEAFKIADSAMYEAKKINGFSKCMGKIEKQ